ncbi:THUMP-like domain-containing protein [Maribacter polysiphoniae]|uniref:THUMP-like domain-containing protein n=1 Tax=Maribacter polysiphoniae TaxID=429344 RepID=UPI00235583E5|nr:class I SAM-dependent methyltransferase [Maribacter polysiphoniae]
MNKNILNTGVQGFIINNLDTDIMSVILKKSPFRNISSQELAEQIQAKKKCKKKLPHWFNTPLIYYPNKLNIEQCSSETTAKYKASILSGKTLVDLTGGLGVDTYFFSKGIDKVFHCEINQNLSEIAAHNLEVLGVENTVFIPKDGLGFLNESNQNFDWLYVDPSRRSESKGKVFMLSDCSPNIVEHLPLLFQKSKHILIKTSPLLDITIGLNELAYVKEIHVVALKNEVKELLWVLEREYEGKTHIKTLNIIPPKPQRFSFNLPEEKVTLPTYELPLDYLYEPNAALLKAGAFKITSKAFRVHKLHEHSHLFTSKDLLEFPGRVFRIEEVIGYSKMELKPLIGTKANITVRNFPESVASIRKKHKIKDGGKVYLFFTRLKNNQLAVIKTSKVF